MEGHEFVVPLATGSERPTGGAFAHCTLRDWFAGQALAGMFAAEAHHLAAGIVATPVDVWASNAYRLADAMLAESVKE